MYKKQTGSFIYILLLQWKRCIVGF